MHLILEFEKSNYKWQIGAVNNEYPFRFSEGYNLGCDIYMDVNSIGQFLSSRGTLTADRYPQSDITKPISFFLDPKILVLNLDFAGPNEVILDQSSTAFSSILGGSEPMSFILRKFVLSGSEYQESVYGFEGIVKSITRSVLGNGAYRAVVEIEMIEPRFAKLEYDEEQKLIPKTYTLQPKVQGLKFPFKFPVKFGASGNDLKMENGGNTPAVPKVTFSNQITNLKIITNSGVFQFSSSVQDGQSLILDVENISAMLTGIEFNAFCTGWENLTLEPGENTWQILGDNLSAISELKVEFFEKYQSL